MEDSRSIDFAKTASIDMMSLNNKVVNMRQVVKRTKVQVINKLCKQIRELKKKKGTEEQKTKNLEKAERILEEVDSIKKLKGDKVSKYALANTSSFAEICKVTIKAGPRALARLSDHPLMMKKVSEFRELHPDWRDLAAYLLVKQTGRRFKTKKQKQTKLAQSVENINASETMTKAYILGRFGEEGLKKAEQRFEWKRKRQKLLPKKDAQDDGHSLQDSDGDQIISNDRSKQNIEDDMKVSAYANESDGEGENDEQNNDDGSIDSDDQNNNDNGSEDSDDQVCEEKGDFVEEKDMEDIESQLERKQDLKESVSTIEKIVDDVENDDEDDSDEEDESVSEGGRDVSANDEEENLEDSESSNDDDDFVEKIEGRESNTDIDNAIDGVENTKKDNLKLRKKTQVSTKNSSEKNKSMIEKPSESVIKELNLEEMIGDDIDHSDKSDSVNDGGNSSDNYSCDEKKEDSDIDDTEKESINSDDSDRLQSDSDISKGPMSVLSKNKKSAQSSANKKLNEKLRNKFSSSVSASKGKGVKVTADIPELLFNQGSVKKLKKDPFFEASDDSDDDVSKQYGTPTGELCDPQVSEDSTVNTFLPKTKSFTSMFHNPWADEEEKNSSQNRRGGRGGRGFRGGDHRQTIRSDSQRSRFNSHGGRFNNRGGRVDKFDSRGGRFHNRGGRFNTHGGRGDNFDSQDGRGNRFSNRGNKSDRFNNQRGLKREFGSGVDRSTDFNRNKGDFRSWEKPKTNMKTADEDSKPVRREPFSKGGKAQTGQKEEKLHPSWEASKKRKEQSGLVAFQGSKKTFDDD